MMDDEAEECVKATYRKNFERLGRIKYRYDPTNFFRVNQNIKPLADGSSRLRAVRE
jgi:hypothetical protein